jgi:hypothetical protein
MNVMILNMPKKKKKSIVIERSGRILLRSRPCHLLNLKQGDKVVFGYTCEQMFVWKDNESDLGLKLSGRNSQMHCHSVSTTEKLFEYIEGITDENRVELSSSPMIYNINIEGVERKCVAIINIYNKEWM